MFIFSENMLAYKGFVTRCNRFFLAVVSQLCFGGNIPPSDEVVQRLLSYVTVQTKEWIYSKNFAVISDCIDRTPVVRSFLLQLLLRNRYKHCYLPPNCNNHEVNRK